MEKKTVAWDEEIIFTNWTDSDFNGVWDKKVYKLDAGKSYYLKFYLAEHFGKGLIDRELIKNSQEEIDAEIAKGGSMSYEDRKKMKEEVDRRWLMNATLRQEMMDKCVTLIPDEEKVAFVRPKEAPLREAVLKRDLRAQQLREDFPGLEVQVNEKAIKQAEVETIQSSGFEAEVKSI